MIFQISLFSVILSIVLALALEQARPLSGVRVDAALITIGRRFEGWFNAGTQHHGAIAWSFFAALPVALVLAAQVAIDWFAPWLVWVLGVVVLYFTVGFRQYSHYFTDIHLALRMGELDRARALLGEWRGINSDRLNSGEVARLAIEQALVNSHRHVFAPLLLFALFGPAGAALYRLSLACYQMWGGQGDRVSRDFAQFSRRAYAVIDWLPQRVTAVAFAVVGDFEDAVFCWRTQARLWPDAASGILLSSGAGALGVRLGMPLQFGTSGEDRPVLGMDEDADADFMRSTIGLVWRTLVLGVFMLALLWVASWT